jgi:hypothetical protein
MIVTGPLAERTVSAFPLSIGTSLAFESLFAGRNTPYDTSREIPEVIKIANYKELWINLSTLYRNIVGAIDKLTILRIDAVEMADCIEQEIEVIQSLLKEEGMGVCTAVFYFCDYHTLYTKKHHNAVKMRVDNTDYQKIYTNLLLLTMKQLKDRDAGHQYHWLDDTLKSSSVSPTLLISHVTYDLLSYKHFRKLDLLETHTGKLKTRAQWYSKYAPLSKEDLSTLPFTRKLLFIFGDKVMFSPMDIRFRKMILEISRSRQWNPMTTEDKIKMDLDLSLTERYLYEMYLAL